MPYTEDGDAFRVHYTGQVIGSIVIPMLLLSAFFGVVLSFYLNDETRWMFARNSGPGDVIPVGKFWLVFLPALVIAPLLDLLITLSYTKRDAVALVISKEGVTGRMFHQTKFLPWSEIDTVDAGNSVFTIHKRRSGPLKHFLRYRGLGDMNVNLKAVDHSATYIHGAIERFAPWRHPARG